MPDSVVLIVLAGCIGAMAVALLVGLVNGVGVAVFGVSPFIMTLGVQSVGAGIALFLTGGVPITGFPHAFGDTFGFGRFGVPVPVAVALLRSSSSLSFFTARNMAVTSMRSAAMSRPPNCQASTRPGHCSSLTARARSSPP